MPRQDGTFQSRAVTGCPSCLYVFNKPSCFIERFDHENRSHGISDLQKAAEEGFSNLVFERLRKTASRPGRLGSNAQEVRDFFDPPVWRDRDAAYPASQTFAGIFPSPLHHI